MSHDCEFHKDNQGFCWTCGKPVDKSWWLLYCSGGSYDAPKKYHDEWHDCCESWNKEHPDQAPIDPSR